MDVPARPRRPRPSCDRGSGAAVAICSRRAAGADLPRRVAVAGRAGAGADRRARAAAARAISSRRRAPGGAVVLRLSRRSSGGRTATARWSRRRRGRRAGAARRSSALAARACASRCRPRSISATPWRAAPSCRSSGTTCCSSAGFCAIFLPRERARAVVHVLFRLLLFKLYFESGIAKWQSPLHDWQDGSAMTFYYETAPLPTWLAWYAHHLPVWWHHFESRATLALRAGRARSRIFAPAPRAPRRPPRLLTGFQLINVATANYGFFCYLGAGAARVPARRRATSSASPRSLRARLQLRGRRRAADRRRAALARVAPVAVLLAVRLRRGLAGRRAVQLRRAGAAASPRSCRCASTTSRGASSTPITCSRAHHARAHRARDPDHRRRHATWTAHDLRHKPGDPERRARLRGAAPAARRLPALVLRSALPAPRAGLRRHAARATVRRSDRGAGAVSRAAAAASGAVRIVYWHYHFTSRRRSARHRRLVAATNAVGATSSHSDADR